jgi:hypothetical protein
LNIYHLWKKKERFDTHIYVLLEWNIENISNKMMIILFHDNKYFLSMFFLIDENRLMRNIDPNEYCSLMMKEELFENNEYPNPWFYFDLSMLFVKMTNFSRYKHNFALITSCVLSHCTYENDVVVVRLRKSVREKERKKEKDSVHNSTKL